MSRKWLLPDDFAQSKRFIESAKKLGCDEDDVRFKEKLKRFAKTKPQVKSSRPD